MFESKYPIKDTRNCNSNLIAKVDEVGIKEAHVYIGNHELLVGTATNPIKRIEKWKEKCMRYIVVDMSEHTYFNKFEMASKDSKDKFNVGMTVIIKVTNPELIVQKEIDDGRKVTEKILINEIISCGEKYDIKEYEKVKREVNDKIFCDSVRKEIQDEGFALESFTIEILPSHEMMETIRKQKEYEEKLRNIERETELLKAKADAEHRLRIISMKQDVEIKQVKVQNQNIETSTILDGYEKASSQGGGIGKKLYEYKNDDLRAISEKEEKKEKELQEEFYGKLAKAHSDAHEADNPEFKAKLDIRADDIITNLNKKSKNEEERVNHKEIETNQKNDEKEKNFTDVSNDY